MVLLFGDDVVYEPSYEVSSLKNQMYYDTYVSYKSDGHQPFEKEDILKFIEFIDVSNKMNQGDFCRGEDLDYYNNQFNYIMDHYLERNNCSVRATLEPAETNVFWCEHEICLESTDPFRTEGELNDHISEFHSCGM